MTQTSILSGSLNVAILFLVFNRPCTTSLVFEMIRQAKPKRLYVAADGPREGHEGDVDQVAKVQRIATAVDWPCDLKTLFRERNFGCGQAIKCGIDWFFAHEEKGIILEDDTIPVPSFFWFCEELLDKYKEDTRIGMIAGTNHIAYKPEYASYLFSKNKACWGWATWHRAWRNMDFAMKWRSNPQSKSILENMGTTKFHKTHWKNALKAIDHKKVSAWDWQWYFSIAIQNQLCIFPASNLIANIGFGDEATHTKGRPQSEYIKTENLKLPIIHPEYICPDYDFDSFFERKKMKSLSITKRFIPQKIKRFIKGFIK